MQPPERSSDTAPGGVENCGRFLTAIPTDPAVPIPDLSKPPSVPRNMAPENAEPQGNIHFKKALFPIWVGENRSSIFY